MLYGFENSFIQEESPLAWLQRQFEKISWVQEQKYPGCIATSPIYDKDLSIAIAKFFYQRGLHNSVSGKSKQGNYHRVFLKIDDVRNFMIADKYTPGHCLQWQYVLAMQLPTDALETLHSPTEPPVKSDMSVPN